MQVLSKTIKDYALGKYPYINTRVLAVSTAESLTIPPWAKYVILAGTVDFWIDERTTAAVPAADVTNGTSPVLIPGGTKEIRNIDGVVAISVISAYACIVTAEFYSGEEG